MTINSDWKRRKKNYEFGAPCMSHDNYFCGKKLYIFLAPHNIYQKQKTESIYLIPKNYYGPFRYFSKFSLTATEKIWRHFKCFFMKQKIICWDFRQGVNLPREIAKVTMSDTKEREG